MIKRNRTYFLLDAMNSINVGSVKLWGCGTQLIWDTATFKSPIALLLMQQNRNTGSYLNGQIKNERCLERVRSQYWIEFTELYLLFIQIRSLKFVPS